MQMHGKFKWNKNTNTRAQKRQTVLLNSWSDPKILKKSVPKFENRILEIYCKYFFDFLSYLYDLNFWVWSTGEENC